MAERVGIISVAQTSYEAAHDYFTSTELAHSQPLPHMEERQNPQKTLAKNRRKDAK